MILPPAASSASLPESLPLWLSLSVGGCLLVGSLFTLAGALGLACFRNFYDRLHMPTLGTSFGGPLILAGCALYVSCVSGGLVLRDILPVFFLALAAPISVMLLARAAAMRDFTQNWHDDSDNMFWQLAQAETMVTDETDAEAAKTEQKEDAQEQKEQSAPLPPLPEPKRGGTPDYALPRRKRPPRKPRPKS